MNDGAGVGGATAARVGVATVADSQCRCVGLGSSVLTTVWNKWFRALLLQPLVATKAQHRRFK